MWSYPIHNKRDITNLAILILKYLKTHQKKIKADYTLFLLFDQYIDVLIQSCFFFFFLKIHKSIADPKILLYIHNFKID